MGRPQTVVFQSKPAVRRRPVIVASALAVLFVLIGTAQPGTVGAMLAFASAAGLGLVAYRNWVSGLVVTPSHLVIRDVMLTHRMDLEQVAGVNFIAGLGNGQWGFIRVQTMKGRTFPVPALRCPQSEGFDLAQSINQCLARQSAPLA
ncbi:MAG: hypothetical protein ACP5QO_10215 [Clostridia bacterium]